MNFAYTIIYVADVEKAIAFYESAFGFQRRFVSEDGGYGELETGGTILSFANDEFIKTTYGFEFRENAAALPAVGIEIAFTTPDVKAAYQKAVAAGAVGLVESVVKPWGQEVAYVRDLNGVLVELATPMG